MFNYNSLLALFIFGKSRTFSLLIVFVCFRKNPKVEKYRSAVHELYMRPYNYVSYEMGGSSPSQYRYQYHTPSSSSSSSSYPSYSSYNKEPEPVSYPSYQPSTNHATFHPPPVAALEPEPSSSYPAPKSSYPSFSVFQNTPYSFHDFDTKLGKGEAEKKTL